MRCILFDPELDPIPPGLLDWAEIFGREAPVELELGIGKGRFLKESAHARPEHDFLGLEISRKWVNDAKRRILKDPPPNLRLLCSEAQDFLERKVGDASLAALHVYHPDPWPKRRHHRRRLLQPRFLVEAARVLRPGAELLITTDHADYGKVIALNLDGAEGFIALPWGEETALPGTHFEVKYRLEGRTIYRFRMRREERK
jgi:tRNA (guanine-N7-)-methyltransferase